MATKKTETAAKSAKPQAGAKTKSKTETVKEAPVAKAATATVEKPAAKAKAPAVKAAAEPKIVTLEAVAERAYHIWQERGGSHGSDVQDWLRAEAELASNN